MIFRVSSVFGFLTFLLPFVTASHWSRRHQEVAHRARGDVDVHRRQNTFSNARFTFYDVGLGACGQTNVASDWIVALNVEQYGNGYPGPYCFQSITIQYGGKTAQAVIMDECMGCPYGGLDFSRGLFDYFADESLGVLYGMWWFDGGSGGGGDTTTSTSTWTPPTTTWEPPATTSTPDYTPPPTTSSTPDYTPPPTTSSTPTYTPPPTTSTTSTISSISSTSSTSSTFTSSAASSINLSTGLASGLAVQTGGAVPAPGTSNPQNILVINNIMVDFGIVLTAMVKDE